MSGLRLALASSLLLVVLAGCSEKPKAESARKTPYDGGDSGLAADDVQAALDELAAGMAALQSDLAVQQSALLAAEESLAGHGQRLSAVETSASTFSAALDDHGVALMTAADILTAHDGEIAALQTASGDHDGRLDTLETLTAELGVIAIRRVERTGNLIRFEFQPGVFDTLDLSTAVDDVYAKNSGNTIAYRKSSGAENAELLLNLGGTATHRCGLFHEEDDVPVAGLQFAADAGGNYFSVWGVTTPTFVIEREGEPTHPLGSTARFVLVCL